MARHVAAVLRAAAVVAVALLVLGAPTAARKHRLRLVDEDRHFFLVSSFGLLRGGSITIRTSKLEVGNSVDRIGMSIHRSSEEATEFILDSQSLVACIFDQVPDDNTMRLEMNRTTGAFLPVHDNLKGLYVMTSESSDSSDRPVHEALLQVDGTGEDIYTVAFHMCSTSVNGPRASLQLDVVEVNPGPDYLGAGLAPLPSVYALMAVIFALLTALWVYVLITHRNSPNLFKVHYLMLAVVAVKTLSLAAHAADYHFIKVEGAQEEGWAVVWYILHFSKGLLLFLTVLLVGAGFGFVKHVLSDREKRLFAVIIALQVFGNIGLIVLEETSEGTARRE